ncbi:Uncharacterised protein [Shigella sonnei]|nr:Uncharacterised protein [Shigella sonnei]
MRIEGAGFNRTYPIATEQHRISWRELPGFFAIENHTDTFRIRRGQRWRVQQIVFIHFAAFRAWLQFDINSRQQRSQAANPFATNLRFHHPKDGVFMQQFFHTRIQPHFDFNVRQIISQCGAFNHADVNATAFNGGFATFNSFRIRGDQGHFQSLMAVMIKKNPGPNERRDDRKYPHGRPVLHFLDFGFPIIRFHTVRTPHALIQVDDPTTNAGQTS